MKIQYCSDLHLEFRENAEYLARNPIQPEGSILLLAGDVVPFASMDRHAAFFDLLSSQFETVYWLPGNHEYYHGDIFKRSGSFTETIRDNIFLINNTTVEREGIRFIFSTLWSHISSARHASIQRGMADFQVIRYGDVPFAVGHANHLHQAAVDFLKTETVKPFEGTTMVVTHHVPTFEHYPEKFAGSPLNEAFATNLDRLVVESGAHFWLYGHHHQLVPDFTLGKSRLLTNQLGYVKYREHEGFTVRAVYV